MRIWLTAKTDVGRDRVNNEDDYCLSANLGDGVWAGSDSYISLADQGALAVVADGMGGPEAGEVASSMAIKVFKDAFSGNSGVKVDGSSPEMAKNSFESLFCAVQESLMTRVNETPETIGMGTTLVALWLVGSWAYVAWCGDSRCYVYHPDTGLQLLTKDHSYVQEMIDRGEIDEEEAFVHPDNNLITRGLGDIDAPSEPEFVSCPVKEGDIFLLCSDGLCGSCRDAGIEKILAKSCYNLKDCRDALIQAALDSGGYDNITVALLATASDNEDKDRSFFAGIRRHLFRIAPF